MDMQRGNAAEKKGAFFRGDHHIYRQLTLLATHIGIEGVTEKQWSTKEKSVLGETIIRDPSVAPTPPPDYPV